jgi:2-polyprenyl-6-methoxyphenol hydroxylase-like FAD-dependent oxidoreductase
LSEDDVLIAGGGPAGSAAARLLAAWGHRVRLVDRPSRDDRTLAESIPPSARKVLSALGALTAIEDAGFLPWHGNQVWWGSGSTDDVPRTESFPAGVAGFQVVRSAFDAVLQRLAAESGAVLERGTVREVRPRGSTMQAVHSRPPRSTAVIDSEQGTREVSATFILDCSGRTGVVARQGLRRADSSHHTVALVGVWNEVGTLFRQTGENEPRPGVSLGKTAGKESRPRFDTLVAAYADGWAWSVPVSPAVRYVTVMVDPQRTALARGASALDVYKEELAKVAPFRAWLDLASLTAGPWGADASLYSADRFAGPGFLLAGDAASFIDPLSSFGVKKALASGWLAAIAIHTALTRPAMAEAALEFFERRERAVYAAARTQAAAFAAEAAARTGHPFWLARATAPDDLDPDADVDAAGLARDRDVMAAFEDLRSRHDVRFRTGDAARLGERAAVRGREIVMEDHLFLPAWPNGLRYIRNIDLVALLKLAPAHQDIGDLIAAYMRDHGPVPLPDFLGALATLVAKGALAYV